LGLSVGSGLSATPRPIVSSAASALAELKGLKVELPVTAPVIDAKAIRDAVVLIASAGWILDNLHSPEPLLGGVVFWLLWRALPR